MMDISLELKGPENTLIECLKRFTQPEKLGSKDYSCVKCGRTSHVSIAVSYHLQCTDAHIGREQATERAKTTSCDLLPIQSKKPYHFIILS